MIEDKLLDYLKEPKTEKEIFSHFQVDGPMRKEVRKLLNKMEDQGRISRTKKDRYQCLEDDHWIKGEFQGNQKGFGFVLPIDQDLEDIYIDRADTAGALDQDQVLVKMVDEKSRRGQVVRILSRGRKKLVGTFDRSKKDFGFVRPDDHHYSRDIYIGKKQVNGAKDGEKVVVEITSWPDNDRKPEGKILEILGHKNDPQVEILAIAKEMDIPMDFSKKTLKYAREVQEEVDPRDCQGRLDLRGEKIFTIDGADSKDFDDAISIEKIDKGYRLGVHIADVAHYVKEGRAIDKDAYTRGNSVYLLSKVIPMLPKELSNGICSLNPHVDRLCLSVIMDVDLKGRVKKHKICESVIQSKARLVYDDVSDYLDYGKTHPSFAGLEEDLDHAFALAKILQEKRHKRGAINFDMEEREIKLDENERVLSISIAQRRWANKLIEEFMILCNETVAEHYYWMKVPFLYRIHQEPDKEKLLGLNQIMRPFGYRLNQVEDIQPGKIQDLLESVQGKIEYPLIEMLVLRSLKKAKYSPIMEGHFGLASRFYSHFTSPIRRYSDLQIHRIIKDDLHGLLNMDRINHYEGILDEVALHVSATEKLAVEAERRVEDVKIAGYMEDHLGEEFDGMVSGITGNGVFVQLENTVEGYMGYESLEDHFTFDENRYIALAKNGRKFYLGMKLRIRVESVEREKGHINFSLVGDPFGEKKDQKDK